jgi:isoleucyl-tRNA synthetase
LKEAYFKFFIPLLNTYSFFALYSETDDIDKGKVPYAKREELDKWLLSKYNKLLEYVIVSY